MKYQFVTSMNKIYFDRIGSIMLDSWSKHWKNYDCELVVYGEDFDNPTKHNNIVWKDWSKHCADNYSIFEKKINGPALKFAKKGMVFIDAMENTKADRLIWVDADILFYKKVPIKKFDELLPDNKLIAFFDQFYSNNPNYTTEEYTNKEKRTRYGAESGFVILNPHHKNFTAYRKKYKDLYVGEKKNKFIGHWYDSEVVVIAARDFLKEVIDLSKLKTTNKTQTPLNRTWMTEYFSHYKANSKYQFSQQELKQRCNL